MLKSCLGIALFSFSASAATFDPPDLKFEYELHRQYLQSMGGDNRGPRSRESLTESYRILGGDTLWSLSQMLYGDGQFWPRVWSQNQDISNPHLIRPGHTLQFMMGSEDDTPAFRFSEADDEGGIEFASSANSAPVIEIPPPEFAPRPVLKLPNSFPYWQTLFKQRPGEILDDRGLNFKPEKIPDRFYLLGYVQEFPLNPIGDYQETDGEFQLPVVNQYIYLRIRRGVGSPGQTVLIVKDTGNLHSMNPQWNDSRDLKIHHIQISGEAELVEKVNEKKSNPQYDSYRALLKKTTGLSFVGHEVIPGQLQIVDMGTSGPSGTTQAQIIGSDRHVSSLLYGPGDVVFLSRGSKNGVSVGQIFDIYADRTIRTRKTSVAYSPARSGKLKVVRVTDRLATAVVLESHDGLQQGDLATEVSSRTVNREEVEVRDGTGRDQAYGDDELDGNENMEDDLTDELDEDSEL